LDAALWTFDPLEFIPHSRLETGASPTGAMAQTGIWLTQLNQPWPQDLESADTLVNMTNEVAPQAGEFNRVIEVVSDDPADKAAARQRWRHYKALGMDCQLHEV
jgi:DNA polymerase-3 subunit chi